MDGRQRFARRFGLVVGAVLLVLMGFVIYDADKGPAEPSRPSTTAAEFECEDAIKAQLQSPASAEFSGQRGGEVEPDVWRVTGTVDTDSEGRATYGCELKYADGEWQVVSADLLPS